MSLPLLFLPVLAVAAGVDLHLTLVILALAGGVGWLPDPPGALTYLGSPWVVLPALLLYLVETLSELRASAAVVWHLAQTLVRPLATGALGLLLFRDAGVLFTAAASLGAAAGAWLVHGTVLGWDVRRWLLDRPGVSAPIRSVGRDAAVVGLVVLALDVPHAGALVSAAAVLLFILAGARLIPIGSFGGRLVWDRAWSLVGRTGWRSRERLPGWLVAEATARAGASPPRLRGWPVGMVGEGVGRRFRSGWLVVDDGGSRLVRRGSGDVRAEAFDEVRAVTLQRGELFDRLVLDIGESDGTDEGEAPSASLVISKRGPELGILRRAILDSARPGGAGTSEPDAPGEEARNPAGSRG